MSIEFHDDSDQNSESFQQEVLKEGPPWVSILLIACYAAGFAGQMTGGLETSVERAGEDKDLIVSANEYWRILTGSTLHGGLLHIVMNTFAFYSFGKIFETISNRWHVAIVFLCSAIAGSVLSLIVNPHGISVGASGGIVGIVGYLAVYSFKRRKFISSEFRRNLLINIGIILIYGLVLSVRIDNAAHIGGLVLGAFYALIQVPSDDYADPRTASKNVETAGIVSIGIYAATCVFAILTILAVV